MSKPGRKVTVREFIETLTEKAGNLPEGLESTIELAICNQFQEQFIDDVEAESWVTVDSAGKSQPDKPRGVIIIGHWHPDDSPGLVRNIVKSGPLREDFKLTKGWFPAPAVWPPRIGRDEARDELRRRVEALSDNECYFVCQMMAASAPVVQAALKATLDYRDEPPSS